MSIVLGTALAFSRRGHEVFPVNWPIERDGHYFAPAAAIAAGGHAAATLQNIHTESWHHGVCFLPRQTQQKSNAGSAMLLPRPTLALSLIVSSFSTSTRDTPAMRALRL
jgi:hypothetical protein